MILKKPCIGIIGAGRVGAETANQLLHNRLADCILFDASEGLARARALDLSHSAPVIDSHVKISASADYSDLSKCSVIVVTAGLPRKEGMSRDDLLEMNLGIIRNVSSSIRNCAGNPVVIVVTNPLDTMTHALWKLTGLPSTRVIGMAGELDSTRFKYYLSVETGIDSGNIETLVLGSHGDLMVPLISRTFIRSQPLSNFISEETIGALSLKTRDAGGEIVKLSGNGSGYYAAASCIAEMVNCILNDKRKILCCSVKTSGEYGLADIFIGLPTVIGKNGVEKIIDMPLQETEKAMLRKAAGHLLAMQQQANAMLGAKPPV